MTAAEETSRLVAVRPPEYWPSLTHFALADVADEVVLADTLQYSRQSFQNRARVRTPQGWQWISVPLKGGQHGKPICKVAVRNSVAWAGKHWRALHYNYRTSPFFEFYEPQLRPLFELRWNVLGDLTCATVEVLAELLGISTPLVRASALHGRPDTVPRILEVLGSDALLSAADAAEIDRQFTMSLRVLRLELPRYRQNFDGFEPDMSSLDLLFNYGPEALSMIRRSAEVKQDSKVIS